MISHPSWITPDWTAPATVRALSTTRRGGVSVAPYNTFNLGVGADNPESVHANRQRLETEGGLARQPVWLRQVHGTTVVAAHHAVGNVPEADAAWTDRPALPCAVLTADCLPILLCNRTGTRVAAVHAGWRGLAEGVVEQTVSSMEVEGRDLLAWMGPAIGPDAFEVGPEMRERFVHLDAGATAAFRRGRDDRWLADLYALARRRLINLGVRDIFGGGFCTYSDDHRFFSYRRDRETGRMATVIWLE